MTALKSSLILSLIDNVSARARGITGALNGIQRQSSSFLGIGARLAAFGATYLGVTQGIDATAGAAMRFETAFADVKKVVDGTDQQMEYLRSTIQGMSKDIPLTTTDIAALFAAAGESGIATTDLKQFAEMAARVGIAFDMGAGEAGESLAKLKTQLGLSVAETGDMADAINHLSNSMASKAKDVTEFMLRVGALSEMGGLAKEEVAAMGSAMIAAGAQAETAGTAMQNVIKAMTRGASAKKGQKDAARILGLDLTQLAKDMQKDAPEAIKKVLKAIAKMPKDRHISLLSDFFGDEAKSFAPLIGNIGLLDQALDAVSDKAKYGGSAFREFAARANTTANVLQLMRNRIGNIFEGIGESMLPSIKEAALGINDVLDTLDKRATIFDRFGVAIKAFMQGFGADGGVRETINDLGDLLFGKADGSAAADQLGLIFAKFKLWGASVRELTDAIAANPIAQFLGELGGYGVKLMLAAVGIGIMAGAIRKLAGAMLFLSGASTALAVLKGLGKIYGAVAGVGGASAFGASAVGGSGAKGGKANASGSAAPKVSGLSALFGALNMAGLVAALPSDQGGIESMLAKSRAKFEEYNQWLEKNVGSPRSFLENLNRNNSHPYAGIGTDGSVSARPDQVGGAFGGMAANDGSVSARPVAIDASSIAAMVAPSGVQQVQVMNATPVTVAVSAPITITGITSPQAAADAATSQLGAKTKAAVESSFGGPH